MSAGTYNYHSALWCAFGAWLTGKRLDGKRPSMTGACRLSSNPFEGFGKRDEAADRRRVARALTLDDMARLLDHAHRRPLEDALTVRRGRNAGQPVANVSDERRAVLERLGLERSLIYKTLILTGLRANELRTLRVGDLSFGDLPFLVLRAANEKNRKGSSVPLKSDLATDLRVWTKGKATADAVFNVPAGLLRILNRDLVAAGIDKVDERQGRVHLHALRHSTGTHLSADGVSPRTAQAVMRHSNIALTMGTYTDERLLQTAGAVELLPMLPIDPHLDAKRTVTPVVTLDADKTCQTESISGKIGDLGGRSETGDFSQKPRVLRGLEEWACQKSNLGPLHYQCSALTN